VALIPVHFDRNVLSSTVVVVVVVVGYSSNARCSSNAR